MPGTRAQTRAQAEAIIEDFMPELNADNRTHFVAGVVFSYPSPSRAASSAQHALMQAAADLLPDWAKVMNNRRLQGQVRPLVRAGAPAITRSLGWAFVDARRMPTAA